nr:transglutaminase-like domain-containing protein [uncultured Dyadobacter sp.]
MRSTYWHFLSALLCLIFSKPASAQQQELDAIIKQIDFKQDTIRSAFEWVANEIEYDMRRTLLKSKTLTWENSDKDYVREVIVTKKGICFHYARLFDALVKRLGYQSYVIDGYVIAGGRVNDQVGHVWNAVRVNQEWLMFDPTWASGYVIQNRFVKKYDDQWFANKPSEFAETHIPFDPLWQFQHHPLSHIQIQQHSLESNTTAPFQFEDSLRLYEKQSKLARLKSELARIDAKGVKNQLLQDYLAYLDNKIKHYQHVDWMDSGFRNMQRAVDEYNNYVAGKNRRFKNPDWSDGQLQAVPDSIRSKIEATLKTVELIDTPNAAITANIASLKKKAAEISALIDSESAFIRRYLNTRKPLRRFVFVM